MQSKIDLPDINLQTTLSLQDVFLSIPVAASIVMGIKYSGIPLKQIRLALEAILAHKRKMAKINLDSKAKFTQKNDNKYCDKKDRKRE